jgi:hypothetical protein
MRNDSSLFPNRRPEFEVRSYLAEIRAEPLMNYCAWNEPAVPPAAAEAAGRAESFGAHWPFGSWRELAAVLCGFRRRRPS